jgi:hypothetical protein
LGRGEPSSLIKFDSAFGIGEDLACCGERDTPADAPAEANNPCAAPNP